MTKKTRGEALVLKKDSCLLEISEGCVCIYVCLRLCLRRGIDPWWETVASWRPSKVDLVLGHPLYFHKIPAFGEVNLGMITCIKSTILWPDIIRCTFSVIIIYHRCSLLYQPSSKNSSQKFELKSQQNVHFPIDILSQFVLPYVVKSLSFCASSKQRLCWTGGWW